MAWTDITFAFEEVLTSTKMTNLDENFDALANGDSGAPAIQTAALADGAVTIAKISGPALGWHLIATKSAADSANVVFDSGDHNFTDFDLYVVTLENVTPRSSGDNLQVTTSTDGGTNFDSSASDYRFAQENVLDGGGSNIDSSNGNTEIRIVNSLNGGAGNALNGLVWLHDPSDASKKTSIKWEVNYFNNDATVKYIDGRGSGIRTSAEDVNGIKFEMSSGNMDGVLRLYGVSK